MLGLIQFFRQTRSIARIEAGFFLRRTKLVWSLAVVALIPSLYTVIYLSSLWDPAAHSTALKVGIVNLDQGLVYREQPFNIGQELTETLQSAAQFDYMVISDAAHAKQKVRKGELAFSLIIPENFSANAIPGEQAGAGQLVVFASQGNNVETARIAQQFASELGHKMNERLNAKRWSLVLTNAAGSKENVTRLQRALQDLHQGATELSTGSKLLTQGAKSVQSGAQRLSSNVSQLTQNTQKLGAGLRNMETNRPRNSDLRKLSEGADALANGVHELGLGLNKLKNGSHELSSEVSSFKEEADNSLWITPAMRNNVALVSQSLHQLDQGIGTAVNSNEKLEDGARNLRAGVQTLSVGMRQINGALRSATSQFPEDAQLEALEAGASELANSTHTLVQGNEKISASTQRLEMGLALVNKAVPNVENTPAGSPEGLADSVRPLVEMEAAVQNNGIGFIANVIPAALWLGAGIAAFLINLRVLPKHAETYNRASQLAGKLLLPGAMVLLQCTLILVCIWGVLKVDVIQKGPLVYTVFSAGLAFFCIISALTHFMGDAGRALAMLLLAVQLTSSGGVMPVELSGSFFATMSPWLPITWLAHGLKATLFGAFEGAWLVECLKISAMGLLAVGITSTWGRWRFVSVRQLRPQLDL
jgi:putative membrane protein